MFFLIVSLLVISGTLMLALSVSALQRRSSPLALAFALSVLCASIWDFGFAAEVMAPALDGKIFWANIQFLGITFLPLAWFAMTIHYTHQSEWSKRIIAPLSLIPIVLNILIWTNPSHHLFRISPSLDTTSAAFSVLVNDYGVIFYALNVPFGYLLFFLSLVLFTRHALKAPPLIRRQRWLMLGSLALPLLTDALYVIGISPIPNFNLTAVVFSLSGLLISWNVLFLQFLDIVPLAHSTVLDTLGVGVIILDKHGLVADFNPAAAAILGSASTDAIGAHAEQVFPMLQTLWEQKEIEIEVKRDGKVYQYHVKMLPVRNKRKNVTGNVVTLYDISERVRLLEQVQAMAATDPLTRLFNRRKLLEHGQAEILRAKRYGRPLSVMMLDIDNFKAFNDRFGHLAGDKVLQAIADTIRHFTRSTDLTYRYGGDEFLVLLPETGLEEASKIAERIHGQKITIAPTDAQVPPIGISIGLAEWQAIESLKALLQRADVALYDAKHSGKGRLALG